MLIKTAERIKTNKNIRINIRLAEFKICKSDIFFSKILNSQPSGKLTEFVKETR